MTLRWKHCNLLTRMIWLQLTTTTKYQIMNTKPMNTKTNKYTCRLRYITNTRRTLLKLTNTKKPEQHFYDETQNRAQLYFSEPSNKHTQIQQRSNKRN